MVQLTMQIPDDLAVKIQPMSQWLPTILSISLIRFRTTAISTATEFVNFLSLNPSPQEFLNYHVSENSQQRLRRLLTLNEAGLLSEAEQNELDELERLEHLVVTLKAQMAKNTNPWMATDISSEVRQLVALRAAYCCDYCRLPLLGRSFFSGRRNH